MAFRRGKTTKRPGRKFPVGRRGPKKVCRLCIDKIQDIDYKELERLARYVTERGKIMPARLTGACARHQRWVATAIKRARFMALLPYVAA